MRLKCLCVDQDYVHPNLVVILHRDVNYFEAVNNDLIDSIVAMIQKDDPEYTRKNLEASIKSGEWFGGKWEREGKDTLVFVSDVFNTYYTLVNDDAPNDFINDRVNDK
jgi:hypothetical protein